MRRNSIDYQQNPTYLCPMGLYGRMWFHYLKLGGVTKAKNMRRPGTTNHMLRKNKIYKATVNVYNYDIEVVFINVINDEHIITLKYNSMQSFTNGWHILDRRLLTEKTIPLELIRY